MRFGISTVDGLTANSTTRCTLWEHERIRNTVEPAASPARDVPIRAGDRGRGSASVTPSASSLPAERRPRPPAGAG
jgi:hypothetical protein